MADDNWRRSKLKKFGAQSALPAKVERSGLPLDTVINGKRLVEVGGNAGDVWVTHDPEAHAAAIARRNRASRLDQIEDLLAYLVEPVAAPDEPEAPLLPAPDALMSDWGDVGPAEDITGDMLLDAFELDEAETVAVVQTLSALRLKHLSEQLNVERARLDREHQATGVANPRSASIDRLLGLLTRRGEV
jgi:hypothetical protein